MKYSSSRAVEATGDVEQGIVNADFFENADRTFTENLGQIVVLVHAVTEAHQFYRPDFAVDETRAVVS